METEENNQSSQLDVRCSSSCTRAGLTILLFSALAIAMLLPLEKVKQFNALADYVYFRYQLKDTLDQLEAEPCWKVFITKEGNQVSSWLLSVLLEIYFEPPQTDKPKIIYPSTLNKSQENKKTQKNFQNLERDKIPPAPPTLRISYKLWHFQRIAEILTDLGSAKLLTLARSYSPRFSISIYRWEILRKRMISNNRKIPVISRPPEKKLKEEPSIPREELTKYLTLDDIRDLSNYELLELSDIDPLRRELSYFNLPSLGMPVETFSATYFIQLGLIFSLAYFWLFQYEAKLSKNYPAPGTLFGVFQRTYISQNMFKVFVALPAISSALLAIKTLPYTYWNAAFTVFVVGFSIMIVWNWFHEMKKDLRPIPKNHAFNNEDG